MKMINYPRAAGSLKGFMLTMDFINIPGVEFTDREAFRKWMGDNIARIENECQEEVME